MLKIIAEIDKGFEELIFEILQEKYKKTTRE